MRYSLIFVAHDEDVSQLRERFAENLMLVELKSRDPRRNHGSVHCVVVVLVERIGLEVVRAMVKCQRKLLQCEFVGLVVAAAGAGMGWA